MSQSFEEVGSKVSVLTAKEQPPFRVSKSDEVASSKQDGIRRLAEAKRSDLRNGLTRRQRVFILEKLVGLNDKDAALAAGYSLSVAENTKQRIWKPRVCAEWERLRGVLGKHSEHWQVRAAGTGRISPGV